MRGVVVRFVVGVVSALASMLLKLSIWLKARRDRKGSKLFEE